MAESGSRVVCVGVDASDISEHAFDWYLANLHRPENKIVIIHSVEVHASHPYPSVFVRPEVVRAEFEREKEAAKDVEVKYKAKLTANNLDGEYRIEASAKPGETIVHVANELKAEMIITGTRGLGTVRRTILGSVSDYVIHHAHCAVIVVRKDAPI